MEKMDDIKEDPLTLHKAVINNKKYQYYELGSGKKEIIFLHGLGSRALEWVYMLKSLSDDYTVYFPDLPGHHNIPFYGIRTTDKFSRYFIDFIKFKELKQFALVGFSFGGVICLNIAEILLNEWKIDVPVVTWAAPLTLNDEEKGITSNGDLILKIAELTPRDTYRQLLSNRLVTGLVNKTKRQQNEVPAPLEFDITKIKDIHKIMNSKTPLKMQNALYIFGTMDPFVKLNVYDKINVHPDNKVKIKFGGHLSTAKGKREVMEKIKEFLGKNL